MVLSIYIYTYIMNSEYGEWKLLISHFFQLVLAVTVFKEICCFQPVLCVKYQRRNMMMMIILIIIITIIIMAIIIMIIIIVIIIIMTV